jgi:ribosome-binding factor A
VSRRTDRVSGLMREEISRLLVEGLSDPRLLRLVTIARVEMSSDLQHAVVAVTVLGEQADQRTALAGLAAAAGFMRRSLAQRLHLKRAPELRFELDEAIREGDHVLALLDSIRDQEPDDG